MHFNHLTTEDLLEINWNLFGVILACLQNNETDL